jgi:mannose-1-phosphate guanylyltransferase / mannose-6-phosphate isomerase
MLVPVIISGGAGTRLWPVSREARPKPFMQVKGGVTLLQSTLLRSAAASEGGGIVMVTNRDYYFQSKEQLEAVQAAMGGAGVSFLLEPVGRNTAAAITMSALLVQESYGPGALMLVLPADHLIENEAAFKRVIATAAQAARGGDFLTFGVIPTCPETGYGYIECAGPYRQGEVSAVRRFEEKPELERAQAFVAAGNYLWNSGMFCFRADAILGAVAKHAPEIHARGSESWRLTRAAPRKEADAIYIETEVFPHVPAISIDYAVMERAPNVKVIPSEIGWSDIGSWRSISELVAPDAQGNKVVGEAVLVDTGNTYVQGERRIIAAVGVENLIVVDTPDALLVGHRDKMQLVKEVVDRLRIDGHESARLHRTVHRPWGTYTVLEEGRYYKMKRILVKPGASLSLQMHKHRSEHWVVVDGVAEVVNGEQILTLQKDQSTYIPAGHKHRLSNPGESDLMIIEVQTGGYLGEDDIVRFEDKYGR